MTGPTGIYLNSCVDCDYFEKVCMLDYDWKTCPRRKEDHATPDDIRRWFGLPSPYLYQQILIDKMRKKGWK